MPEQEKPAQSSKPTSTSVTPPVQKEVSKQDSFKHIVRIANIDIPGKKQVRVALTKIKGVGINFASVACIMAKIDRNKTTGNLNDEEIKRLNEVVNNPAENNIPTWMFNRRHDYETGEDKHLLTGTLSYAKDNDLKRLKKIKTLRGMRHQKGLPVRGQRTRSNFRKSKGKVVGVAKKKTAKAGK